MVVITGFTNFVAIPGIHNLFIERKNYLSFFGFFTFITSFMYHTLDSLDG